jgi:RimJ/RimL family protein N-acetyltransferase
MENKYLFKSQRLGFRNWETHDHSLMSEINKNQVVMEFFPTTISKEQTSDFILRMQILFLKKNYCYFAVDHLKDQKLIGFLGLSDQDYEAPFTPCVDIGWRFHPDYWGQGLATEGALKCLEYGFNTIHLKNIKAVAPLVNTKSIHLMKKIGLEYQLDFLHPRLTNYPDLHRCVCYQINNFSI